MAFFKTGLVSVLLLVAASTARDSINFNYAWRYQYGPSPDGGTGPGGQCVYQQTFNSNYRYFGMGLECVTIDRRWLVCRISCNRTLAGLMLCALYVVTETFAYVSSVCVRNRNR
jgi:hypothetical protein